LESEFEPAYKFAFEFKLISEYVKRFDLIKANQLDGYKVAGNINETFRNQINISLEEFCNYFNKYFLDEIECEYNNSKFTIIDQFAKEQGLLCVYFHDRWYVWRPRNDQGNLIMEYNEDVFRNGGYNDINQISIKMWNSRWFP
jgi:hypothetical protein